MTPTGIDALRERVRAGVIGPGHQVPPDDGE
jgi:hypothetical protein